MAHGRVAEQSTAGWPTKAEAAEMIGISTKTVEALAKSGKLQQGVGRSPRGVAIAVYHPADVDRERKERNSAVPAFVVAPNFTSVATTVGSAVVAGTPGAGRPLDLSDWSPAGFLEAFTPISDSLVQRCVASLTEAFREEKLSAGALRVSLRRKIWLTLREASALSGLPQSVILAAARAGAGRKLGAGWRIRRSSLESIEPESRTTV